MGPEIAAAAVIGLLLELRAAVHRIGKRVGNMENQCDARHGVGRVIGAGIMLLLVSACAVSTSPRTPVGSDGQPQALLVRVDNKAPLSKDDTFDWQTFLIAAGTMVLGGGVGGVVARKTKSRKGEV